MTDRQRPESAFASYNAAVDLLAANLATRADKIAVIDDDGAYTYAEVARRVDRCGAAMLDRGAVAGDRVVLCLLDGVDLVACFLGAIRIGLTPIPLNTLLTADDYGYILNDSGATMTIVSPSLRDRLRDGARAAGWPGLVAGPDDLRDASPAQTHWTSPDTPAFWLYSSGSTGRPKGVIHRHGSLRDTADLFGGPVLGICADDVVYSAAKLFFAYGLGNGLTFPFAVGATVVLHAGRATPEAVWDILARRGVTVFGGVPTLYAAMLSADAPTRDALPALRLCVSAGEPLPQDIGARWTARTGTEIIDGVGSTEMLHVFVSNRPGAVRYGTSGVAVAGYELKLLDETGVGAASGVLGELYVRGPSAALGYWNQPEKTAHAFVDGWVRTGDQYRRDDAGDYVFCGRADDMLKVSGIWVSPAEVESVLITHPAVLEAAVVGAPDADGLIKVKAYVVLRADAAPSPAMVADLRAFAKTRLTPHKYPRDIAFVAALPKTATGKIRRHVLREG